MASNSRVLSLAICKTISVASARSAGLPLPLAGMADDGHPNYLRAENSADRDAYMAAPAVPGRGGGPGILRRIEVQLDCGRDRGGGGVDHRGGLVFFLGPPAAVGG